MDDIIHFISTHYELIINCLVAIVSIVFFILRKKNVLVDPGATDKLVDLVREAENKFGPGKGEDKLSYVICKYFDYLGTSFADQYWMYLLVKEKVEKILSTPQKKK